LLFVGEKTVILMKQTCALYLWLLNADIWINCVVCKCSVYNCDIYYIDANDLCKDSKW